MESTERINADAVKNTHIRRIDYESYDDHSHEVESTKPTLLHLGKLASFQTRLGRLMSEEKAIQKAQSEKNSPFGYV